MTATNSAGAAEAVSASEQSRAAAPRICICGTTLCSRNRSGACRSCRVRAFNVDPSIVLRRAATLRARFRTDSLMKERHRLSLVRAAARRKFAADNATGKATPPAKDEWCPTADRALNRKMKRDGFTLSERRRIILADVPGTVEHARRTVRNHQDAQRIRAEREKAQAY